MASSRRIADDRWGMSPADTDRDVFDGWQESGDIEFEPDIDWAALSTPPPAMESTMSDPDRDNADLRAKLAEAQTDKKFSDVLGEFRTSQAEMNGKIDRLVYSIGRLGDDVKESRSDNKFTRWTIAGLAIGMFGVVIALVALMLAMA